MEERGKTVAIYSRKSKFTGKGESIGNQTELCRDYIQRVFGAECAQTCQVFEDEGFSGGDLNRPAFCRMMEGVRSNRFRAIVVYRLDRISRNISDFAGLIRELTRLDISFISIREQFDTSSPMGRAMMYIISVFSQLERETIAERIRDNMRELAKTGRWLGGNTPTGYSSESISYVTLDGRTRKVCRLKLIPEEAELVKRIFSLYRQTDSLTAVETELCRSGLKSRQGRDFSRFAIRSILKNPVYMTADEDAWDYFSGRGVEVYSPREAFDGSCGLMVYNRTEQEKGKAAVQLPMTEWIVAVGKHPGLIPGRQWADVQASLERNRGKTAGKSRRNEALLAGLLFCRCGERMYPRHSGRDGAYGYVCRGKERSRGSLCGCANAAGNLLDSKLLTRLQQLPEQESAFLEQLERNRRDLEKEGGLQQSRLAVLRAECAENERKIRSLMDALSLTEEPGAKRRITDHMEALVKANESLEERIRETRTPAQLPCWQDGEMTLEEKRRAVRLLVRKVIWNGQDAHVLLAGAGDPEG